MQAVEFHVEGIKCDASGCGYEDNSARLDDYESFVNKPCPDCGAILLTEEDMKTVKIMLAAGDLVNAIEGDKPDDSPTFMVNFAFDGSGKAIPSIIKVDSSREPDTAA